MFHLLFVLFPVYAVFVVLCMLVLLLFPLSFLRATCMVILVFRYIIYLLLSFYSYLSCHASLCPINPPFPMVPFFAGMYILNIISCFIEASLMICNICLLALVIGTSGSK